MSDIIPQVLVRLTPEGDLVAEIPVGMHRRIIELTPANAGQRLLAELRKQQRVIDGKKAEATRHLKPQTDFRVIAQHFQAEIREHLTPEYTARVTKCPPGKGVDASRSDKTAEELGL